ncbi:MAG: PD40 domain-containing protein [Acidobacteria bacterium]|nr:PD40 domain-containing protein [Acidobacteriota bacterium]
MKKASSALLSLLVSLLTLTPLPARGAAPRPAAQRPRPQPAAHSVERHANSIRGSYLVVLRADTPARQVEGVARGLARANGGSAVATFRHALRGFAANLSAQAAEALARDPRVAYVEEDAPVELASTTQTDAPWGLDRIDQRDLPLSTTYTYGETGAGAHVYVIDSGIRTTHQEFGGRASVAFDNVGDGGNGEDCFGHGTHVASVVGGETFGVAKGASLHAVRIFNCSNGGSSITKLVAAIDFITGEHQSPAVALLSVNTVGSSTLDAAVRNSIAGGITYVVAAGNLNIDAGNRSPSRVQEAITVGATDETDTKAVFSNYGSSLDLFAPGVNIPGANWNADDDTTLRDGTSMAAAHAAGVAARFLETHPLASPAAVAQSVVGNATYDRVINPGPESPNRLLYRAPFVFNKVGGKIAYEQDGDIYLADADGGNETNLTNSFQREDPHYRYGGNTEPAWSPDGTKIAFVTRYDEDGMRLNYVNVETGDIASFPFGGGDALSGPAWSPDGSKLAWASYSNISVRNVDGTGVATLLTNSGTAPAWSPDGTKVAFQSARDGNFEIYVMNSDGTGQTRLTNNSAADTNPYWSPDGGRIAFTSDRSGNANIYSMLPDGSGVSMLTDTNGNNASWSAGGDRIAFDSERADPSGVIGVYVAVSNIFVMAADGSNETQITHSSAGAFNPDWQPLPSQLAFLSTRTGNVEIFTSDAQGGQQTRLTHSPAIGDYSYAQVWSPNGTRLAYASYRGSSYGVYVANADGTGETLVTQTQNYTDFLRWTPDGNRIAFEDNRDGIEDIFVVNLDGTGEYRLTNSGLDDIFEWDWSPDGTKAAFSCNLTGDLDLCVVNADGTDQFAITSGPDYDFGPDWSPDGTTLVFYSYHLGDYNIYRVSPDGSGLTQLTTASGYDFSPIWSPDGSKIAFVSRRTGNDEIFLMNADGSSQTNVSNTGAYDYRPEWAPDGSRLTFTTSPNGDNEVFVVRPNGSGLKNITQNPSAADYFANWRPSTADPRNGN